MYSNTKSPNIARRSITILLTATKGALLFILLTQGFLYSRDDTLPEMPGQLPPTGNSLSNDDSQTSDYSYDSGSRSTSASSNSSTGLPFAPGQSYILKPKDVIRISVYQEEDLAIEARIASDGSVDFPLLGAIYLANKTIQAATAYIESLLRDGYLVNPQVTLQVIGFSTKKVVVLGQVNRPGPYELSGTEEVSLVEAIGMAGGYTRLANQRKIAIKRQNRGGEESVIIVDGKALAKEQGAQPFMLQAGDVVTVPERVF